jgi:hypothetical protein
VKQSSGEMRRENDKVCPLFEMQAALKLQDLIAGLDSVMVRRSVAMECGRTSPLSHRLSGMIMITILKPWVE